MNIINFDLQCIPAKIDLDYVWKRLLSQKLLAGQTVIVIRLIPDELIYRKCWPYYHGLVSAGISQALSVRLPDFDLKSDAWEIEAGRVIFRIRLVEKT